MSRKISQITHKQATPSYSYYKILYLTIGWRLRYRWRVPYIYGCHPKPYGIIHLIRLQSFDTCVGVSGGKCPWAYRVGIFGKFRELTQWVIPIKIVTESFLIVCIAQFLNCCKNFTGLALISVEIVKAFPEGNFNQLLL